MRRAILAAAAAFLLVPFGAAPALSSAVVPKKPQKSAQDGGGGQTVHVWIEVYSMGQPPWAYYCRYASDGQTTWQVNCWT